MEPVAVAVEPAAPGHAPDAEGGEHLDHQSLDEHGTDEGSSASSLLHVPIKRKGSRKR